MRHTINGPPHGANSGRPARFTKVCECDGTEVVGFLIGCLVVTAMGERIGRVDHMMVDAITHQPRYAMIKQPDCAMVAIPWQALYFDVVSGQLVFYTWFQETQTAKVFNEGF